MAPVRNRTTILPASLAVPILLACGAVALAAETGTIVLTSPVERQVYQRDAEDKAVVTLAGTAPKGTEIIEYTAALHESATLGEPHPWGILLREGTIAEDGAFSTTLTLVAGGWYTIKLNARKGTATLATTTHERIGVGDVYVIAGDMLVVNYGKEQQKAEDDRVVHYDGRKYRPAHDPIPGSEGDEGSPWPILGDLLARTTQVPVCFVSAALTWTRLEFWLPESNYNIKLFKYLVGVLKAHERRGGVRAILWEHGASDSLAETPEKVYYERMVKLIKSVEKSLGHPVVWFVAGSSYHPYSKPEVEREIFNGQKMLWREGIALQGPTTDGLLHESYRKALPFTARGLRVHAELWYGALWAHLLAGDPESAGPAAAKK